IDDARELTQETFVRVYRSIARWEPRAPFKSWMFRIALNLCRDHVKSRRHREKRRTCSLDAVGPVDWPDPRGDTLDDVAAAEALRRLEALVAGLPPNVREPLILHVLEGQSVDETAAILGLSRRAVETRVYRARQRLREKW
ncbi:MAG: RNA polymerase sigma factor, partial [Verrucomicrobiota bacterium]